MVDAIERAVPALPCFLADDVVDFGCGLYPAFSLGQLAYVMVALQYLKPELVPCCAIASGMAGCLAPHGVSNKERRKRQSQRPGGENAAHWNSSH